MNVLVQTGVGSTDWAGGRGPEEGTRTGTAVVTMKDGVQFSVNHGYAEVLRKLDVHAVAPTSPQWVAFDLTDSFVPAVLDVGQISSVSPVS